MRGVSKDGHKHWRPSFETHRSAMLLRMRLEKLSLHALHASELRSGCDKLTRRAKFRLTCRANHGHGSLRLIRMRGVSRTLRTLRWDAVDAWCATDDRARGGRRSRVVPTPRRWRQVAWKFPRGDGGKKAGHQGERGISRKPPRRESRIASAGPVCSCAFFRFSAHGTAGAARTRLSLRPLCFRRVAIDASLGRIAPRERGPTPHRCLAIESEIRPDLIRRSALLRAAQG